MDAVDDLIVSESPPADHLWVLDRPALVAEAARRATVSAWCDDRRDADTLDPDHLLNPLTARPEDLPAASTAVWTPLPTSLDALDELCGALWRLARTNDLHVVAGGRIKHMTHSMNDVASRWFDDVHASLGVRKARVLHFTGPRQHPAVTGEWPRTNTVRGLTVRAHGAVFHTAGLDAGTALLLCHLDRITADCPGSGHAVDLGCGNGIIAANLARDLPGRRVTATDVSWAAVDSTILTATANDLDVETCWADGLTALPDASVDLVVTNPPFHQGTAQDHAPTIAMLTDAARVLKTGGVLWCVHNNHLPWASQLRRHVGPTRQIDRNRHYTVTRTVRRTDPQPSRTGLTYG